MNRLAFLFLLVFSVVSMISLPIAVLFVLENGPDWISAIEPITIEGVTQDRHKGTLAVWFSALIAMVAMFTLCVFACMKLEECK